jgi:beta-phosphoglucomutase
MAGHVLVFDLDGVIIDSNPVHTQAWCAYLERFGIDTDGIDTRMHGKRNDEIVRELFGRTLDRDKVHAHGAAKEELYRRMMGDQLRQRLVPGVTDFLERHRDTAMGLASNAEPANVDFVIDGAELRRYFRAIVNGHEVTKPKPDPEIYLQVARLLKASPQDCVVFEDSPAGITAAQAAGTRVVVVEPNGTPHPSAELTIRDFCSPELERWLLAQPVFY